MPPHRRKTKKGTLHYALDVCDRGQLTTIISTREDLDGKASLDVMNIIRRSREFSRVNISPLQGAVSLGNYNICKQLVEEGAVLKSAASSIPHPLCLALEKRHYEIAHLLIQAGADVNLPSKDSLPLEFALDDPLCKVSIVKQIIDAGFPVNETVNRSSERTALHSAVRVNNIPVVKYLLSISANPNMKDNRGLTPLHYAVQKDLPNMVKLLSKNGAHLDCECLESFTPMFYSIATGNYEMVKLLISLGADIHYINNGSKKCSLMPLHFAANICQFKIVQLLIEKGADVNKVVPRTGETPLHSAARGDTQNNQQYKIALDCIVELLVKHKADVKVRHNYGLTPLQVAIKARNLSVAKILIINGSELNNYLEESDDKSYTTFHVAAKSWDKELIKVCFDYGADCNATDEDGFYPIHLALLSSMIDILTHRSDCNKSNYNNEQLVIFKMFWKHGFPFDITLRMRWLDNDIPPFPAKLSSLVQKQKMLFRGLKAMNPYMVEKAIIQGAEVKCCSIDIPFPVHYIVSRGNFEILKMFLMGGVNTNSLDNKGRTPLYIAAREGHIECCLLLLEYGACYNYSSSKWPETPLKAAKAKGHKTVVRLLKTVNSFFKGVKKTTFQGLDEEVMIFRAVMNCCSSNGLTLLATAVQCGMKSSAEQLIKLRSQCQFGFRFSNSDRKTDAKSKLNKREF